MKYERLPISFEQQADLLISRGLIVNRDLLIDRLKNVNYYRLSGYLYPYRKAENDENFKPGTTLDKVWRHYTFDRRLRLILMDAIERVEVSVRTQLVYALAHQTQAFGYVNLDNFFDIPAKEHVRFLLKITEEVDRSKRSKDVFVQHFFEKYGDFHKYLPIWMAGEIMSFGSILTIYCGVSNSIRQKVSAYYDVPDEVFTSWLKTINVIRNICAHHSRLWNRELGVKPFIPKENKYPEWHQPVAIGQNRIFGILTILHYLLKIIAPQSKWKLRLYGLLDEYPQISRWSMGFPDNWKSSPLWKDYQ